MKKRISSRMLLVMASIIFVFLCVGNAMASNTEGSGLSIPAAPLSNDDYYDKFIADDSFGGVYYEGDTLVVNYVGDYADFAIPYSISDADIEYRAVEYSLQFLECVKDYLGKMTEEYSIHLVDANEMTNKVDILLGNYSEESRAEIITIIDEEFGGSEFLNFLDGKEITIKNTIAYEQPDSALFEDFYDVNSYASERATKTVFSGMLIKVNDGYMTLGPATSSTEAYSAGHGFRSSIIQTGENMSAQVYSGNMGLQYLIGNGVGHCTNARKDWAKITGVSSNTFFPIVNTVTSNVKAGTAIYMYGAVSKVTGGTVTRTNAVVNGMPGMCAGSYFCQPGDSGAAIFNSNQLPTTAYGIQSAAGYDANDNWVESYFTPFPVY